MARRYRRRKYIAIPDKRDLDLGKPLVLDFAREFLPVDYDEVRHIFSRRGAYRRYKGLLVRRRALDQWYDFSNKAEEAALMRLGRRGTHNLSTHRWSEGDSNSQSQEQGRPYRHVILNHRSRVR